MVFKNVVRFDGSGSGFVGCSVEGFSVLGAAVVVVESRVVEACVTVVALVVAFSVTFDASSATATNGSTSHISNLTQFISSIRS